MRLFAFLALAVGLFGADKYTGPRPPKSDIPYLLHANKLVETEVRDANSQQSKDGDTYSMPGPSSSAKTPLAEPIFVIESDKINPNAIELYRLEVKGGNREITVPKAGKRGSKGKLKQYRLTYTKLADRLYKIEAAETLESGQYSLSPSDSNKAFCFEVY
jgi:hypothetical protein